MYTYCIYELEVRVGASDRVVVVGFSRNVEGDFYRVLQ